ncbi:synaptonemal complex protein 2-like [Phyllobates terribilis]|uniref:synaptonemal complex protein 2-like n=1 Tax=Phyllobates terribilis TaxID=111132 RepID=UPI003CCB3A9B
MVDKSPPNLQRRSISRYDPSSKSGSPVASDCTIDSMMLARLDHLEKQLWDKITRDNMLDSIPLMRGAAAFLVVASDNSVRLAARSAALSTVARRILWLKCWPGDLQPKSKLCSIPCERKFLFGPTLDDLLEKIMTVLDLRNAYYHIPIHKGYQKFLRVALTISEIIRPFQKKALPFGLAMAPQVFTKLIVEVMAHLREKDFLINPYLDYFLLETLITDAFKGKEFQKICELLERKPIWSSQRCCKLVLNQLDRSFFFFHYMVLWFERTLEFLKICMDDRSTILALADDFYDTVMAVCECPSKDGVKQVLDNFFFTFGLLVTEKWPPYQIKLEALRTLNGILNRFLREEKKKPNSSEEMFTLMQSLARKLFEVGDYDIQVGITEVLFRMTSKKMRAKVAQKWFEDSLFAEAFTAITEEDFETDCRKFLIFFNSRLSDAIRVHSFPCISVSTDIGELTKPQDDKLEHFWIDFNVCSESISFYTRNNEGSLWQTVKLQKESLSGYSLEECNGQKLLSIHLKIPQSINNKAAKYIKMTFEIRHAIQNVTIKTYGAELQMNVHLTSPEQTDTAINLPEGWKDSQKGSICEDQVPISIVSDTYRVLENTANKPLSEVLSACSERLSKNLTTETEEKQSAENKAFDIFEFKRSSQSDSDIEPVAPAPAELPPRSFLRSSHCTASHTEGARHRMSAVTINAISPPSSRKTITSNLPRTRSSQKTKAKMAVDYKELSSSGSELSWILESSRKSLAKSLTKSADYSRKRQKIKSKLKVLPLSSPSSGDQKKTTKMVESWKDKEMKMENKQKRGMAESLSFSGLKLPGVSALLTPSSSQPQTSGTLHLSDLDQDTMDPLVDDYSSDDNLEVAMRSDTTREMDIESNEDKIEFIKERHASGEVGDSKKRKRTSYETPEITLKPRKLFISGNTPADLEDDVFHSDTPESDITECSFISSFETFTASLKKTLMASYKKMEVRAQDGLKISHQHVSTLMNQIQQSNLRKLDHFQTLVAHHVSSLQAQTQAFINLEKKSMDFWEAQTVKINEFCTNQRLSIEAIEHSATESLSFLKKAEERTIDIAKESLQKL